MDVRQLASMLVGARPNKEYNNMKQLSSKWTKAILIVPTFLIYTAFLIVPIFIAIYYSMTNYSGIGKAVFVGLKNYKLMLSDKLFLVALKDTGILLAICVLLLFVLSFIVALLLNKDFRGGAIVKAIVFAPYVIAPILVGIIWTYLLNPNYGLFDSFFRLIGLDKLAIEWIGGTKWSPVAYAIVFTWQVLGFHATIFLAGIKTIPADLYEAAQIDGAGKLRRVFSITIPLLKETIIINSVLIITGVFKIYELVYQLTNGGPAHQSEVLVSYMFYTVFTSRRYGYGMAIATIVLLLSVVGSFMYIRLSSQKQRKERTEN